MVSLLLVAVLLISLLSGGQANGHNMALVLYDEGVVPPHYKPQKHFQFGGADIVIKQDWAKNGVAGVVWDAAVVLCEYLVDNQEKFDKKRILELGAGTGLAGICAFTQGAHVVLTDREESLAILKENVQLNIRSVAACDQEAEKCQMQGNGAKPTDSRFGLMEVQALDWADRTNALLDERWDVVIGTDIIYIESTFTDLLYVMRRLQCPEIILSCRLRYDKDHRFITRSKESFDVELIRFDRPRDVNIYSFRQRK